MYTVKNTMKIYCFTSVPIPRSNKHYLFLVYLYASILGQAGVALPRALVQPERGCDSLCLALSPASARALVETIPWPKSKWSSAIFLSGCKLFSFWGFHNLLYQSCVLDTQVVSNPDITSCISVNDLIKVFSPINNCVFKKNSLK